MQHDTSPQEMGFQVRSLDPKRFSSPPAGRVTGAALRRIEGDLFEYLASELAGGDEQ